MSRSPSHYYTEIPPEERRASFWHPKNIKSGHATVIYAEAQSSGWSGDEYPEGWVLPGGRRTQDMSVAMDAADAMDAIMRGAA